MSEEVLPQPEPDPGNKPTVPPKTVEAPSGDVKELRLGLVCYGGVSLAIYMHGITKEIHRAVRASVMEERGEASRPDAVSELAYRELLRALRSDRDVLTRIVVDAIAGSSAGGINGIFLAKALSADLDQDALRDLWFEYGDLGRIVNEPEGVRASVERLAARVMPGDEDDVPSEKTREKLLVAALHVQDQPLLQGNVMARQIFDALGVMDGTVAEDESRSLMPPRHLLELCVTVTDHYGYVRYLPIADPPVIAEGQHRHLLEFRYRSDGRNDFGANQNGALTLAARATSSLPVGFQPVHVGTFPDVLDGDTKSEHIRPFFRAYELAGSDPSWAHLVDGGVLDNKPFGPVLKAIKERPAANEVERYLLFLEPDPKPPVRATEPPNAPRPIPALLGALSGLPRSEPILDELHDVLVRNEYVGAVRDTIEANWAAIEQQVLEIVADLGDTPSLDDEKLREANRRIHEAAIDSAKLAYPIYVRLKASSAIDSFAGAACLVCDYTDASNQAYLVRAVIREWARSRKLFEHDGSPTEAQVQFIRDLDLEYSKRRLQFVLSGVSWLYRDLGTEGTPTRQQLDAVKERLSVAVGKLEWLSSGAGFATEVLDGVSTCFGEERLRKHLEVHRFDTASFLREHADELDSLNAALRTFVRTELTTFTPDLYRDLLALTADWPEGEATEKTRRDLLIRYLAFPIWDALLYPLQAYTDVNERDAVRVARVSPVDSTLLEPVGEIKVLGAQLGHAYAFFSLKARENDYLWGRLDAAERMVRLLLSETTSDGHFVSGLEHTDYKRWCKRVFGAILEEEKAHLPTIADDVNELEDKIAQI